MISSLQAAKALCEISDWTITNLKLQKILYIANMVYMGNHGNNDPLISNEFEAWKYGPVLRDVYHKSKIYGNDPIGNVFDVEDLEDKSPEYKELEKAWKGLHKLTAGQLVNITHYEKGAWKKNYDKSLYTIIPHSDVLEEYKKRND